MPTAGPPDTAGSFSQRLDRKFGFYLGDGLAMRFMRGLIRDRLTFSGRVAFFATLASSLLGGLAFTHKTYLLTCGLGGLMLVSLVAARWARVKLRLEWEVPSRVTRGASFAAHFQGRNLSRRPARDVTLEARIPHWAESQSEFFEVVESGQEVRGKLQLTFPRRGHYVLEGLRQATLFPFGLWRDWFDHPLARALLVYPDFHPLHNLHIPVGRRYQPGGIALTSHLGDSTEFLCTREFRDGDNPRLIHWRSWARLGKPVVKEFQEEFYCRVALILDTFLDAAETQARREDFEAAVTLAAAVADHLSLQEYVIDLFAAGPELYQLQAGRSLAHFENVMDILACVQPCSEPPFEKLEPVLLDSLENITTTVVLLLSWDERRERLIQAIHDRGCALKIVLVGQSAGDTAWEFTTLSAEQIVAGVENL